MPTADSTQTQTAVIILGAFVFVLLGVAIGFGVSRCQSSCRVRKTDTQRAAGMATASAATTGPSNAHGWYDCVAKKPVCDSGYESVGGHACTAKTSGSVLTTPPAATATQQALFSQYTQDTYPALTAPSGVALVGTAAAKGAADLWRTLDLFYTGSCIQHSQKAADGASWLATPRSNPQWGPPSAEATSLPSTRLMIKAFESAVVPAGGAGKRFTVTAAGNDASTKAACVTWALGAPADTYYPAKYSIMQLPLSENWGGTASSHGFLAALSVNRYSPPDATKMSSEGDSAYCVVGTANTEYGALMAMPGVTQYLLRDGFKSNAWIEIAHNDTHYQSSNAGNLNEYTANDMLSNHCVTGKWLYGARGTGIWYNLGKTEVAQSKVDVVRHVINMWDGKLRTLDAGSPGHPATSTFKQSGYTPTQLGKLSDTTKLATWLQVVKSANGTFLAAALSGVCSGATNAPFLAALKGNDGTDQIVQGAGVTGDPLNMQGQAYYREPFAQSAPQGTAYCNTQTPGLWWCNSENALGQAGGTNYWWGSMAPLAPAKYFLGKSGAPPTDAKTALKERQGILSWILWASVNGYDFAANVKDHIPGLQQQFTGKTATEQAVRNHFFNAWLTNLANMARNTDDLLIQYTFNAGLDSLQLMRSSLNYLQVGCEIMCLTGSVYKGAPKDKWRCAYPAPLKGTGSYAPLDPAGADALYSTRDPLNPADTGTPMKLVENHAGDAPYLSATAGSVTYNIGEPVSMPYYKRADGSFTVPMCSDLATACAGHSPPPPPPPPGTKALAGQACPTGTACADGLTCSAGYCLFAGSSVCEAGPGKGQCQMCSPVKADKATTCGSSHTAGHPNCYAADVAGCKVPGSEGKCSADCPCFICACSADVDCPSNKPKCGQDGKCTKASAADAVDWAQSWM